MTWIIDDLWTSHAGVRMAMGPLVSGCRFKFQTVLVQELGLHGRAAQSMCRGGEVCRKPWPEPVADNPEVSMAAGGEVMDPR